MSQLSLGRRVNEHGAARNDPLSLLEIEMINRGRDPKKAHHCWDMRIRGTQSEELTGSHSIVARWNRRTEFGTIGDDNHVNVGRRALRIIGADLQRNKRASRALPQFGGADRILLG